MSDDLKDKYGVLESALSMVLQIFYLFIYKLINFFSYHALSFGFSHFY